jgi:hypothetical protein
MIVFLSDTDRPLQNVPSHLFQRRVDEIVSHWATTWNIHARNIEDNGIISADISKSSPAAVFQFLDSVNAVCVDLEPSDIGCLAGRDVMSLAAADLLATDPNVRQGCERLEIHEVMDTIAELKRLALGVSNRVQEVSDELLANTEPGMRAIYEHDRAADEEASNGTSPSGRY